jgi:hypothetical protein
VENELIEMINEYQESWRKHIKGCWLGFKNVFKRCFSRKKAKVYARHRKEDISFSIKEWNKFRNRIEEKLPPKRDLEEFKLHIKANNSRIYERGAYLVLAISIITAIASFIANVDLWVLIFPTVFSLFAIIERADFLIEREINNGFIDMINRYIDIINK